ncbi:MAG: hypothetical protein IPN89_11945 [Saprospiraceae bacterium]|nr:hypothetical protein [Saprospiraceae bacterium]
MSCTSYIHFIFYYHGYYIISFSSRSDGSVQGVFDASCEHRPFFTFVHSSLARHLQGDWGDCCSDDAALNDAALQDGGRLFLYIIYLLVFMVWDKLWIITECDRSATTVLFPSE